MSEWSVPSGMTPQDNPRQPKDGIGDLIGRFQAFKIEVRDKFNNLLKAAGIHVEPDLVRFTGAVRIEGTLDLPAGIIGNDALTSPVVPANFYERADGWATANNTFEVKVTETLTVPAGFTQAIVTASAWATATNSSAATAVMYIGPVINGSPGPSDYLNGILPSTSASGQASQYSLVTGLVSGGSLTISGGVRTGSAWDAAAGNIAIVSGVVLWLR